MDALFDRAPVTLILIFVTSAVSLLAFGSPELWRYLALEPYRMIGRREYHGVITSGFVHAGFAHLLVNMMTLFFFGPHLEDILGSEAFIAVYFTSLLVGSLYPLFKYRNTPEYIAIGASGAISGVVFAFCLFEPLATLRVFFAIPMPAFLFAILYVAYSVYAMRQIRDNIGHEAHLAGAVGGILITIALRPTVISDLIKEFA